MTGRKVHLDYVGCRLNQAEIEHMGRHFAARGDTLTPDPAAADLVVVNTCGVTGQAARKSRQLILQAGRANPESRIVVTGCYAELAQDALRELPNVTDLVSNAQKDRLVALIDPEVAEFDREPLAREPLPPGTLGRTRAFIKVQDGCDNRCTFCITTIARGAGRSRPDDEIIDEIRMLHDSGYQEIVLTGVHLGSYGHDWDNKRGLHDLVARILSETEVPRIRLSSLEPWDLTPDFFDLWQDTRLCPHLHLPLQSGSDEILRRMLRRTSQASFAILLEEAHQRIPGLSVTTDIIVGFPGETDDLFKESMAYVTNVGLSRLHVFSYSVRTGTAAARMSDKVPPDVIKVRRQQMQDLSDRLWHDFQHSQLGTQHEVLWESAQGAAPEGMIWSGLTGNYARVRTTAPDPLGNTITPASILGFDGPHLVAHVTPS